jgi:hypothetical protein
VGAFDDPCDCIEIVEEERVRLDAGDRADMAASAEAGRRYGEKTRAK